MSAPAKFLNAFTNPEAVKLLADTIEKLDLLDAKEVDYEGEYASEYRGARSVLAAFLGLDAVEGQPIDDAQALADRLKHLASMAGYGGESDDAEEDEAEDDG